MSSDNYHNVTELSKTVNVSEFCHYVLTSCTICYVTMIKCPSICYIIMFPPAQWHDLSLPKTCYVISFFVSTFCTTSYVTCPKKCYVSMFPQATRHYVDLFLHALKTCSHITKQCYVIMFLCVIRHVIALRYVSVFPQVRRYLYVSICSDMSLGIIRKGYTVKTCQCIPTSPKISLCLHMLWYVIRHCQEGIYCKDMSVYSHMSYDIFMSQYALIMSLDIIRKGYIVKTCQCIPTSPGQEGIYCKDMSVYSHKSKDIFMSPYALIMLLDIIRKGYTVKTCQCIPTSPKISLCLHMLWYVIGHCQEGIYCKDMSVYSHMS